MKIVNPSKQNLSKEKLQFMDELFMDRYISPGKYPERKPWWQGMEKLFIVTLKV